MFDGRDALAALLSLQTANFDRDVLRGGSAVLEWAVSFQTPFHTRSRPGPPTPPLTYSWVNTWQVLTCIAPKPSSARGLWEPRVLSRRDTIYPIGPLSFKSRRWDLRDRSEAERTASHGSQWVTLATGCVLI